MLQVKKRMARTVHCLSTVLGSMGISTTTLSMSMFEIFYSKKSYSLLSTCQPSVYFIPVSKWSSLEISPFVVSNFTFFSLVSFRTWGIPAQWCLKFNRSRIKYSNFCTLNQDPLFTDSSFPMMAPSLKNVKKVFSKFPFPPHLISYQLYLIMWLLKFKPFHFYCYHPNSKSSLRDCTTV